MKSKYRTRAEISHTEPLLAKWLTELFRSGNTHTFTHSSNFFRRRVSFIKKVENKNLPAGFTFFSGDCFGRLVSSELCLSVCVCLKPFGEHVEKRKRGVQRGAAYQRRLPPPPQLPLPNLTFFPFLQIWVSRGSPFWQCLWCRAAVLCFIYDRWSKKNTRKMQQKQELCCLQCLVQWERNHRASISLRARCSLCLKSRPQKHNLNRNHRGEMCDAKLMLFKCNTKNDLGPIGSNANHTITITEMVGFIEHGMIKYLTKVDAFICCARGDFISMQ